MIEKISIIKIQIDVIIGYINFKTSIMYIKQKYVKLKQFNGILIFPCFVEHSKFKDLEITTAGFCYVDGDLSQVLCFGESYSLGL